MTTTLDHRELLAEIWGKLLGLAPAEVPHDAGFLTLGGDSVLAVRMSAQVRKQLGVVLALSDIRVEITLTELAELIARRATGGGRALPVEVAKRADPDEPFPLLPLQQGYFVGQQDGWELSYPSAHHYVDIGLSEVDPDDAPEALQDALRRLVVHQPTLRARVLPDGRQRILPADDPATVPGLVVNDLRGVPADDVARSLASLRHEMSTNGPNPGEGPGIDIRLTLLDDGNARLHCAVSLLIIDGWSSNVFYRDLFALVADWNATLAPLEVDYGDYVTSVRRLPGTAAWEADRDWWFDRLPGFGQPPALPLRLDPAEARPDLMATTQRTLDAATWAAVRAQCAAHGVTPSAAVFTAYACVLARAAGHRVMLLNSLQLNRLPLHQDVHRIIGAFASTMLIPVELDASASFADLALACQRQFGDAAAHNLVSGVEVSRELGRHRGTHRPVAPVVFQSTLGMDAAMGQRLPGDAGPLGVIDMHDHHQQLRTPQVALEVRLFELDDTMTAVFSYVEEIFEPGLITGMFAELLDHVRTLAEPGAWDSPVPLPGREHPDPAPDTLVLGRYARSDTAEAEESGPPRDDVERRIAALWQEILDVAEVDRAGNFFTMGGDSLLAVRALARVARETGTAVSVRDFLASPTLASVAARIRAARPHST
ncbi:condensation domain-containing protein [Amycolatopsis sp. NPDC057786]|uniref:condensation domain-containing protein n=1 Tax=Amycolatopsis sp. NPDC057786 TaxID=3346250 RepID=UPI00366BAE12